MHFMTEKCCTSIRISLKFIPKGLIDNESGLVRVMACHQTSDKSVPKPMLTQFTDTYMQH